MRPWLVLFALLLGIAGFIGWRFFQKQAALAELRKKVPLNPHEEAYQALHQLKHSDLLKKNQYRGYFSQMSEILRRYFERRYEIHALESTTFELVRDLKGKMSTEDRKLVESVLEVCDFVKFAKYTPEVQEILKQNKQAFLIIDQTKQQAQEPETQTVQS